MHRQVVLDTETTGREIALGNKIIEIGCLVLEDRQITKAHFHHYLNPLRESEAGALAVHGLTQDFLQDKPLFSSIADQFLAFIKDSELIIHNAPFDIGFLNYELELAGKHYGKITDYCKVIDTLPLARQLHPGQRNSLDALCKRYSVDNSHREFHGALLDAELLAKVYLAMTGGQTSFFIEENPAMASTPIVQAPIVQKQLPTKVIHANEEELAAHQACMKQLAVDDFFI